MRVSSLCWVAWIGTRSTVSTWSAGMEDIQRKMRGRGMYLTGKVLPMMQYVYLLENRNDMYIGTTVDYGNCIVLYF